MSMDARKLRLVSLVLVIGGMGAVAEAQSFTYRTPNFVVTAPTRDFAEQVGEAAEIYRKELAVSWLGMELPKWYRPCPIKVRVGQIGAGGATTFQFDRGEVSGWNMDIQGSEERILDSVLPHEINHTIFACYFRRPLPRWADEGAATMIEHESERMRQTQLLGEVMSDGSRFTLRKLLAIKDYPSDMRRVLTLYAQGYSLTDFLLEKKGKQTFLKFLGDAHESNWDAALKKHYGYKNIEALESTWNNWVLAGSPRLNLPPGDMLAENSADKTPPAVVRGQNPEETAVAADAPSASQSTPKEREIVVAAEPVRTPPVVAMAETEPQIIIHRAALDPSDVIRLKGRREALEAGWEPVPVVRLRQKMETSKPRRLLEDELARHAGRDRPIFAEETSFSK